MAAPAIGKAPWFAYFPEHYLWSVHAPAPLSMAPWGWAEIGEVDRTCRALRDGVGDSAQWWTGWTEAADRVVETARIDPSRRITAASAAVRGPTTVRPWTNESYCSCTQRLLAIEGDPSTERNASSRDMAKGDDAGSCSRSRAGQDGGEARRVYTGPSSASAAAGTRATVSPWC